MSWLCQCDCGTISYHTGYKLISGKCKSCGCLIAERASEVHSKDLTGQKFGRLTVLERADAWYTPQGIPQVRYKCLCDCGNIVEVFAGNLKKGNTSSCGCYNLEALSINKLHDLTGQRFGKLTVIERAEDYVSPGNIRFVRWLCLCDCGNYTTVAPRSLITGMTKSCGCIRTSYGEEFIEEYLKDHNCKYKKEYKFNDLRSNKGFLLRFDFAILNDDDNPICLIEFQGKQHFEPVKYKTKDFGKQQREETDKLKRDYCRNHNLLEYEIRYDDDIEDKLDWLFTFLF